MPIAAAFTGVQRFHPVLATAPTSLGMVASAAAGLSATALANVPPNQAAKPTSCSDRDRVLRAIKASWRNCVQVMKWLASPDSVRLMVGPVPTSEEAHRQSPPLAQV